MLYRDLLNPSKISCSMAKTKEDIITLEEVQVALRTKELTKSKDSRVDENGEGLSVSKGSYGGRGNRGKSGNKLKFKCFNYHKMGHFKKDFTENNGNCAQIVSEGYKDVGALVVSRWGDEEGDISHIGSDAL